MIKKDKETAREEDKGEKTKVKIPLKYLIFGGAGLIVLSLLSFAAYSIAFQNKNYINQYVGTINLGGRDKNDTKNVLKEAAEKYQNSQIVLKNTNLNKVYNIDPTEIGLTFDVDRSADEIWSFGRGGSALGNMLDQIKSIFVRRNFDLFISLNEKGLNQKIKTIAEELDKPEKDYSLVYTGNGFEITTERVAGERINQAKIVLDLKKSFSSLSTAENIFTIDVYEPKVTLESANKTLSEANGIISPGELIIKGEGQEFKADKDTIAGFIKSSHNGSDLELDFNEDRIKKFLDVVAKAVNVDAGNAKLRMENGKVVVFNQSKVGKALKIDQTINEIKSALLARITGVYNQVTLVVESKSPQITETEVSSLGINELIGTASTSFKGSPPNRVHNITIGANGLNGVLLKPGEEFSTLSHLGVIDASGGYLEELVIKENRTIPEFGGGLCQVSSTIFRTAIYAGMKITERSAHKYRVGYFEPPIGMDATIYDPAPDFKFVNNYKSHVLIQSRIEGTKLTFDIYGTKDGRKIDVSNPIAFDYVNPGEPIITETDTLPAGERKKIESAHQGATARFDYKVTSASGDVLQQKTFVSKYVPWPEKWLVGKAAAPAVVPDPIPATPETPAPLPTTTCTDGTQNGDETGVDCGGSCSVCAQ